ncbi:uncharacterized protein LOC134171644 [Pezoporus occidentalis]|uniref:uncharacterized protein LOC134171644 n=1 Tax=Pezoporus occidentalis TaxID=407982 RepID=UPI002F918014
MVTPIPSWWPPAHHRDPACILRLCHQEYLSLPVNPGVPGKASSQVPMQWRAAEQWCPPHPHRLRLLQKMHLTQTCTAVAMATAAGCEMRVTADAGMRGDGPCVAAGVPHDWVAPRSVFTPGLDSPHSQSTVHQHVHAALHMCVQARTWALVGMTVPRGAARQGEAGQLETEPLTPLSGLGCHKASAVCIGGAALALLARLCFVSMLTFNCDSFSFSASPRACESPSI